MPSLEALQNQRQVIKDRLDYAREAFDHYSGLHKAEYHSNYQHNTSHYLEEASEWESKANNYIGLLEQLDVVITMRMLEDHYEGLS